MVVGFDANTVHFFNSVRFGHTRYDALGTKHGARGTDAAELSAFLSIRFKPLRAANSMAFRTIQISSYATGFNGFGQTSGTPNGSNIRHFEIGDTMTLVRGNHTLNWGGNYTTHDHHSAHIAIPSAASIVLMELTPAIR